MHTETPYVLILAALAVCMMTAACGVTDDESEDRTATASHHTADGFRNTDPSFISHSFGDFLRWAVRDRLFGDEKPELLHYPVDAADDGAGMLERAKDEPFTVTWIGHATLLIRLDGVTILTDPVFSDRASPVSWAGPRRRKPPGIPLERLPEVDVVLISHNHYDHLDEASIRALGNGPRYLVPLGVGATLDRFGITSYQEMDWGGSVSIGAVTIACLPAQHFSSRTLFDRDRTLWCSFAMTGAHGRVYFGGDTGYFREFADIGANRGPFDVAALPIGAYLPAWFMGPVHMGPAEALRAASDLGAKHLVPIHWGAFDLADDPHDHSPAVLRALLDEGRELPFTVDFLAIGETRPYGTNETK